MINFDYRATLSLIEALTFLKSPGQATKVLAGGTDLIVQMKDRRASAAVLVDVKKIPDLNRLEVTSEGTLVIGAAVPLSDILAFPPVRERFGILHQACSFIGSVRIRNRATMGGNICNAAPSADSACALLCLGAKAIVARSGGTRVIPMDSFFRGPGRTALAEGELLVEVQIPAPPARSAGCYMRHTTREEMDIAVVGAGSFLVLAPGGKRCGEVRITLGAVAPTPMRVPAVEAFLTGKTLSAELIEEAAVLAAGAAAPISDMRGSAEYRRELVKVLVRRTLQKSWEALNAQN